MAKPVNPFFDPDNPLFPDFTKLAESFSPSGIDPASMIEAQRKNLETINAANRVAIEGALAVVRRQGEILREGMEEASKVMQELSNAGAPEEKLARQAELTKEAFERTLSNLRELAEMSAKSNSESLEMINRRVAESLDEFKSAVRRSAKG